MKYKACMWGFRCSTSGKESACQCRRCKKHQSNTWVGRSPGVGSDNHSSILAWKIPWREEPGGLQSMEQQRTGHDWAHKKLVYSHCSRRKGSFSIKKTRISLTLGARLSISCYEEWYTVKLSIGVRKKPCWQELESGRNILLGYVWIYNVYAAKLFGIGMEHLRGWENSLSEELCLAWPVGLPTKC